MPSFNFFSRTALKTLSRPYVPLVLTSNGIPIPTTALLDSGADYTTISSPLAENLGLPHGKDGNISGCGGNASIYWSRVKVTIESDGEKYEKNMNVQVMDLSHTSVNMLLGRDNIFKDFKVEFDNRANQVKLTRY